MIRRGSVMSIMVVSSAKRFNIIIRKLHKVDVSQIHFYNVEAEGGLATPLTSLVPFTNMVICEDCVLASPDFRKGPLVYWAQQMNVPILSESRLDEVFMN
jgi:hypothetical protein